MLKILPVCALVLLGGCSSLFDLTAVPYDATADAHAASAYTTAAKIAAEIQLGQLSAPASYTATADQYASLMADIAIAKQRAAQLQAATRISADNQARLASILQACADQAQTLATIQKSAGLQPASGAEAAMMASCSQATNAAAAMKP